MIIAGMTTSDEERIETCKKCMSSNQENINRTNSRRGEETVDGHTTNGHNPLTSVKRTVASHGLQTSYCVQFRSVVNNIKVVRDTITYCIVVMTSEVELCEPNYTKMKQIWLSWIKASYTVESRVLLRRNTASASRFEPRTDSRHLKASALLYNHRGAHPITAPKSNSVAVLLLSCVT
ncbi:hypothetical protein RRG08_046978 [Elysia crispata]|uniref:Uncharacterized protein n=1 Tax=Elysia crispata TaxID=231223 RepID=A0AAE1A8A5_9GAST|nr:hypothetical protein RRG08_046978 [Elysia crispata]